jgi:PAS domain-containing protein
VVMVTSFYLDHEDWELALKLGANDLVLQTPGMDGAIKAVFTALERLAPLAQAGGLDGLRVDHEARLIRQLERQLKIRSGLAQQASVQAAAVSVLSSVSETLGKANKLEAALGEVLAQCVDAAGWSRAAVFLIDADGNWNCPAQFDYGEKLAGELAARLPQLRVVEDVIKDRLAMTIESNGPESGPSAEFLGLLWTQSALIVPILSRGSLIGIFVADCTIRSLSAEGWLPVAEGIASQIGQAIALAKAFEQITASEERYRTLVEHSTDTVMLVDEGLNIRYASQSVGPLLGYTTDRHLGRGFLDLLHPDDRSLFQTELRGLEEAPDRPARLDPAGHRGEPPRRDQAQARREGPPRERRSVPSSGR